MTGVMTGPGCLGLSHGCHGSGPLWRKQRPTTVPALSSCLNASKAGRSSVSIPSATPTSSQKPPFLSAPTPEPSRPSVWKGNK